jgi:hypothetical protein
LLSYLFYFLARRPDVFSKLRAEIMALGKDLPTFEEIKELKYLQYCKHVPPVSSQLHMYAPATSYPEAFETKADQIYIRFE